MMSDNLGPNQTRVLDSDDRSFESVIYQRKKPPLSCEGNLEGNLVAQHSQGIVQWVTPSGWDVVGGIKDNVTAASCYRGDVLTSSTFPANNFELISLDKGVLTTGLNAWVNGWKVVVQGTNSSDENNVIALPVPPSITYRVDFVFLEVWRKLITPSDAVIYKYGNVLYGGTNYANDLIDPAVNIETSLRIQTQYRIRVVPAIDIENNPEGFDPSKVFVQGPLPEPIDSCDQAFFSPVPGDPGLWRAGAGDSAASETLDTVDGYTYAIPMFAITRRNTSKYSPDLNSNGSVRTLANFLAGNASDRPDNLYNDLIAGQDILDLRHRISPTENLKEVCENAFDKLIKGRAQNVMAKDTQGEDHFGKVLMQVDGISAVDYSWFSLIGGAGADDPDGYRRVWANSSYTQKLTLQSRTINQKTVGTPGGSWQSGDQVVLTLTSGSYPANAVFGTYIGTYKAWLNSTPKSTLAVSFGFADLTILVSGPGTNTLTVQVNSGGGGSIVGSNDSFTLEYEIEYPCGLNGLTAVPDRFLEFREKDSTVSIATRDADVRVRDASAILTNDGVRYNMAAFRGAEYTEPYNFGHQMIYHSSGNGTTALSFGRVINGYPILGIARIMVGGVDKTYQVSRTASQYNVTFIGPVIPTGADVEVWLYTGLKFFDTNKQGRGIIDTLEMKEFSVIGDGTDSTFHIDISSSPNTPQPALAIASNATLNGIGYAYVNTLQTSMSNTILNVSLPSDTTRSDVTIQFDSPPVFGALIEVPVLMKSAVNSNEAYLAFYQKTPYQGLLDGSWATGVIETAGPALTTTSGSGGITNFTYVTGSATFTTASTVILGWGTNWVGNIKPGYVITGPDLKDYVISQVYSDTVIYIATPYVSTTAPQVPYVITARDFPSFGLPNIVDRLPTGTLSNDATAMSGDIQTMVSDLAPVLTTRVMTQVQDIVGLPPEAVEIGKQPAARGRSQVAIDPELAPQGLNNLGVKFESLSVAQGYQKTYQSYILNKDESGKLYLVVAGSEYGNDSTSRYLNHMANGDTVDIFDLPGRPLTNRKVM